MARLISTTKPIIVQKERRLPIHPTDGINVTPIEADDYMSQYKLTHGIPEEVMPVFVKVHNDLDYWEFRWWEVTV